jgi:thiamine kinase-like enzyme
VDSKIARVIDELLPILGEGLSLSPIQGGAVNLSFCVKQHERHYFLKLFDSRGADLLDRPRLFLQQQNLAKQNLAPAPIYLSKQADFQLDQWIEHRNLQQSQLSNVDKCRRLARQLNKIHQSDVILANLDLHKDWLQYLRKGNVQLSVSQQTELQGLLEAWQQECEQWSVLCHNDLSFSHVPLNEVGVIFDWEYAGHSSPYFDIASCCVVNLLDGADKNILIQEYAKLGLLDPQLVNAKVSNMLPLVNKTYEFWQLAFTQI